MLGQKWGPDAITLGHPRMPGFHLPAGLLREPSSEKSHPTGHSAAVSWAHAQSMQRRVPRTQGGWSTTGGASASLKAPGTQLAGRACWPETPPQDVGGVAYEHCMYPTASPPAPCDPITGLAYDLSDS